uniref:CactinC_cactus domain-containing protein n=1 Tax=Angiostrongylus cantonensis TaxID=6313 RepID=A0A158P6K6_ANGCA
LKVHISKIRLKELHQKKLRLKLAKIREEQMKEVGKVVSHEKTIVKVKYLTQRTYIFQKDPLSDDEDQLEKQMQKKIDLDELESPDLDDEQKEMRWRQLSHEQLETATLELYDRGGYSPSYGDINDTMPGIEVLDEESDMKDLLKRRQENRKKPAGLTVEAEMIAIARKGMEGDEATFSVEHPLEAQSHLWSDKYRPRKPTYLNRVQTGFDWNKYNQTHYDMDNPPPKIVQGYKFNIFYPDLLDPSQAPSFTVTPCDDPDFAVIRFKAGPPYEDIAFKCVNREWEVSHKHGYKCQFQNGVFQLWFVFKRYRYRR